MADRGREHEAALRRIAVALIDLGLANAAERDFRDAARDAGAGQLRPMAFYYAGDPRDPTSRTAAYLLDAIKSGHIPPDIIPLEWRRMWRGRAERAAKRASKTSPTNPVGGDG